MIRNYWNRLTVIGILLAILTGCNQPKQQTSGINLADLDTIVHPGHDFYQYASGGWMINNPLKDTDTDRDAFAIVQDSVNDRLKRIITTLAAEEHRQGSIEQKIADLYNLAMDSVKLNNEGYEPIKPLFAQIETITRKEEIIPMIIELGKVEASPYFVYSSLPDMANSNMQLFAINQGGLGLGQKEYYLVEAPELAYIREEYKKYIVNLFKLTGLSEQEATRKMEDVIDIEMNIAQASLSNVEARDLQANYHKMSVEELKSTVPDFNWDLFFNKLGLTDLQYVDLRQIEPMKNVAAILNNISVSKHVAYLQYALLKTASSYLSDDFLSVNFNFFGKLLLGIEELSPRWKRTIGNMEDLLGEPIGQLYVREYFSPESKQRVLEMVENLQDVLADRIQAQNWMSGSTKTKAIEKLNAFSIKIGYPDKWKDYSSVQINNDSYWANVCRIKAWEFDEDLKQVGKPVDKAEWSYNPQTVNAGYSPQYNSICFPAAILQPPFFDMDADDAYNYGAIGMVIGHEMTHGFDDQGRHFDKDGNMTDWWNEKDAEEFNKRVRILVDYFNRIEVLPGIYINGELTLGENIADHGGLRISFQAFKNVLKDKPLADKEGFTPEQRFFLSNAHLWATNVREEYLRYLVLNDVHTINKWRVNGALPHISAWYEAFHISSEDSMYIKPEKRVDIW